MILFYTSFNLSHYGWSNIQRRSRCGGGSVTNTDKSIIFLDQEVIDQHTFGRNSLGSNTCRSRSQMFCFNFGDKSTQGFYKCPFIVRTPHFTPSHLPMFHRHFLKARVENGIEKILNIKVKFTIGFPAEGKNRIGPTLNRSINHSGEMNPKEWKLGIR